MVPCPEFWTLHNLRRIKIGEKGKVKDVRPTTPLAMCGGQAMDMEETKEDTYIVLTSLTESQLAHKANEQNVCITQTE